MCARVTTHTPPASGLEGRHAGRPPGRAGTKRDIRTTSICSVCDGTSTNRRVTQLILLPAHILACIGAHMSDEEALLEVAHFESRAEGQ